FTCTPADDGSTYQVIITNYVGSITSSVATLSVSTGLQIDAPLTSIIRNVGSAAAFEIVAEGALPITYQWHNGDGSLIPGATNSILWLSNVQLTNDGSTYYVSVINPYTSQDSGPATLNVQARAVNVPITKYAKVVVADNPVAYWRLDEPDGSSTAVDAVGSFDGAYIAGAGSFTFDATTGIPNETDGALGVANGATVSIPYAIEINPPGAFSVEGWFQPASLAADGNDYRTPLSSMSNPYGAGPTGWLVYQTGGNNWSWWPYNGFWTGVQLTDPDTIVAGQWYYLTLTYDGTTFTFYVNGVAKASGTDSGFAQNGNVPVGGAASYNYNYNTTPGLPTGSSPAVLGWRSDSGFNPFDGTMDDVAVYNYALNPQQIQNHYLNTTHLSIVTSGGEFVITWPTGTLQSATNVSGPYVNVVPPATSPYTNSVSGTQRLFYRAQLQ
ncbi:MAG: LamG domain-containing protein, partial [Verrucomicrobiia bacterium]